MHEVQCSISVSLFCDILWIYQENSDKQKENTALRMLHLYSIHCSYSVIDQNV